MNSHATVFPISSSAEASDQSKSGRSVSPEGAIHSIQPASGMKPAGEASPVSIVQAARPQSPVGLADVEHIIRTIDADNVVLIPAGVTIKCDIVTNGVASVVIAGRVEGNVDAGANPVIIKQSGEVIGTVRSQDSVVVAGKITAPGNDGEAVLTSGLWILAETGHVKGTVAYGRHRAYEGGVFSGRAIPYTEYEAKP